METNEKAKIISPGATGGNPGVAATIEESPTVANSTHDPGFTTTVSSESGEKPSSREMVLEQGKKRPGYSRLWKHPC